MLMKAKRTLLPGGPGTKKIMNKYGDRLLCVRYRTDPTTLKKYKTVELIEEEIRHDHKPKAIPMNKRVEIQIHVRESFLRELVKTSGGKWDIGKQTWRLPYREVLKLGLEKRIVEKK
jgi:hypothetical protein